MSWKAIDSGKLTFFGVLRKGMAAAPIFELQIIG
jgi:hypothetical protein